jgi:hypothetical protein
MMQYLTNLKAWGVGFARFGEIDFKVGWSAKSPAWWFLYTADYGLNVLTGGACESISRMAYRHKDGKVWSTLTRLLNRLDAQHGEESGPALWGTVECSVMVRIAVTAAWGVLLWVL